MVTTVGTLMLLSWAPLLLMLKSRETINNKPRFHIFHDMDHQPKYKAQAAASIFPDGRAARPRVPGTVPHGRLEADDHFYRGFEAVTNSDGEVQPRYLHGLPERMPVTESLVLTGQQQYNIFCAPCHGLDGHGKGPVHHRALALGGAGWIPPADLHQLAPEGQLLYGEKAYADGQLFDVITNGVRTMAPYGHAITPENRWAIVAYIRALQLSQHARYPDEVPEARRNELAPARSAEVAVPADDSQG